jgi:hypothetical protein
VRYACAFDDPNCSGEGGTAGPSRRKPLCRALADHPLHELLADEISRRGGPDRLGLDFDDWSEHEIQEFRALYSACHLPGRVAEYLSELGRAENVEAADAPRSP